MFQCREAVNGTKSDICAVTKHYEASRIVIISYLIPSTNVHNCQKPVEDRRGVANKFGAVCPLRYKNPGGKLLQRVVFTTTTTTTTAAPDWRVHMHRAKRMTQADVARRATVELARLETAAIEQLEQCRTGCWYGSRMFLVYC